ncbi:MAG TPA: class I SAM-dependent methyltransferase [Chloroflexia bacterium]|nr:class I SAM-dependent methyltransferase [Chloroflexia bacterium]
MSREVSPEKVRRFYDRFGKLQDAQRFYEESATTELIKHANFKDARDIFELGCGTGLFARKLFQDYLTPDTRYAGIDISPNMVKLTRERLKPWSNRASVELVNTDVPGLSALDNSMDRFVSNYVFDLLPFKTTEKYLAEAHRVLRPDGLLCVTSLTFGNTTLSRFISNTWLRIWKLKPILLGGCRPIALSDYLTPENWKIVYLGKKIEFGITSEVLVAIPLGKS